MRNKFLMLSTAAFIGLSAPVYAQDDLNGFLDGMIAMASSEGGTVTYDQRNVGTDGSVELVGFVLTAPDDSAMITADWVKGVPSATTPGQVTFTLSPNAQLVVKEEPTATINIANTGLVITMDGITSGYEAETLNYSIMADSLSITSNDPSHEFLRALDISFTDLNEVVSYSPSSSLLTNTGSIAALKMLYDITVEGDAMYSDAAMTGASHSLRIFANDDEDNIIGYLSGNETAFFTLETESSAGAAKIDNRDITLDYAGSSGPTHVDLRGENGRLTYDISAMDMAYTFNKLVLDHTPLPPFDLALDEFKVLLTVPTANSDTFQPASVNMALRNMAVPESLLSIIDASGVIPRDPLNFIVDISANVKSNVDWTNPDAAFDSGNPADIGEIQDISINQVLITAGGAEVTAEGNATIDNSMGFPFPTGAVTVTAKGVQGLVNGMVSLGLLPSDQAGMAMGMMMAFARPGAGADEFISDIEFSPQGVTANGTPLPF